MKKIVVSATHSSTMINLLFSSQPHLQIQIWSQIITALSS